MRDVRDVMVDTCEIFHISRPGKVLSKDHIFCACSLPLQCLQRICSCGHLYYSILLQSEMKKMCKEKSEIQQYLAGQIHANPMFIFCCSLIFRWRFVLL